MHCSTVVLYKWDWIGWCLGGVKYRHLLKTISVPSSVLVILTIQALFSILLRWQKTFIAYASLLGTSCHISSCCGIDSCGTITICVFCSITFSIIIPVMGHNMYVPVPRKGRFIIIGFGGNSLNNAKRIQKMEKCIYSFFLILLFCNNIVSYIASADHNICCFCKC